MKYQQLSSIIGVIDRVGMRNPIEDEHLIIPPTILGASLVTLPLTPKAYEIRFDGYMTPVRNPVKIFGNPFLIFSTTTKHNYRINPQGFGLIPDICYFADELFFSELFDNKCSKVDSDYFVVGGYMGEYNMYCTGYDIQQAIIRLHNRILDRVRKCAERNRKVADKRGTYEIIPWGVYPKSVPDIQYLVTYHNMSADDLLAYYVYLPQPKNVIEQLIRMELHGLVGHLLDE